MITAQNYAIRTYKIKAKIDNSPQTSTFKFCSERKQIFNLIISELIKLDHKTLRDFKIQTDQLISTRRQHLILINKKKMSKALHLKDDIYRLYALREEGNWKRTWQHWRERGYINTMTRNLHRKAQRKTDYSHQKKFWQYKNLKKKTKITRKQNWEEK